MTKAQRADALLSMAAAWQMSNCWIGYTAQLRIGPEGAKLANEMLDTPDEDGFDASASAALSEAAALGFGLVQADGSEDEA